MCKKKIPMNELFQNKVILITGGTGYLGRKLTHEILKFKPHSIRLFSRDEVKHHKVQEEFKSFPKKIRNFLGDIRDYSRLSKATKGADIVIHAAALKRLDLLEYNVQESIKTNIIGTMNIVNSCLEHNIEKAIFISTDKACSPVNTYGASKFISERIFIESNYSKGNSRTIFSCVRYGNVLESTGSVIPFFEKKILSNEKIPLTDPRMTRFIISPQQAVELIFDALKYCVGGEVFVPRLPAFKITDLIDILKEKHASDVEIELIGLRPGEKIHELMLNQAEVPMSYDFKNRYIITSNINKYHQIEQANYVKKGRKLSENDFVEYSSKSAILTKNEVRELFKSLGLL